MQDLESRARRICSAENTPSGLLQDSAGLSFTGHRDGSATDPVGLYRWTRPTGAEFKAIARHLRPAGDHVSV